MKKVLIHHNFKRESLRVKDQLIDMLRREQIEIVSSQPDLVVSIGGDGTMLNAIRKHFAEEVPFIGINTGSLGFLPTISSDSLDAFIDVIKEGKYTISHYPVIKVDVETIKGQKSTCFAFNEVVVKQAEPRLMRAEIYVDDKIFNHFSGDGLIVATPAGTTGYGIWVGGAAMHPDVKGLQLIPMNANDCAINHPIKTPIVLPEKTKLDVVINRPLYAAVVVGCDGVKAAKQAAKAVHIELFEKPVLILRCQPFDYYELYSEKILQKKGGE